MPPANTPPKPLGHQPNLDGLRGIAVLAVLFFHLDWPWCPGGFLGVDVFFTLSGFLITTLLLEEHFSTGQISVTRFFIRRGIRLYPALVALVIVSTAFSFLAHKDPSRTFTIALSVLGYVANWATMLDTSGWFGGMPHTWSLAIEVHFYVLWAVTLALIAKRFNSAQERTSLLKILSVVAVGTIVASAGWRAILWAQGAPWLRMYLGTEARLDAVFIGALAALVRLRLLTSGGVHWFLSARRLPIALIEIICVLALAALFATTQWRSALPGMTAFTLAGLATAGLVLTTTLQPNSLISPLLSTSVMTWFGRISYSLYIWHVPAGKFVKIEKFHAMGIPPIVAELVRFGMMIVVAAISYYLIERTFVRLKNRFEPRGSAESTSAADRPKLAAR